MMTRKILLFLLSLSLFSPAFAQFVATGMIRAQASGTPLANAAISIRDSLVLSDANGFFELPYSGKPSALLVEAGGYKPERFLLGKDANAAIFPEMKPLPEAEKNYWKRTLKTGRIHLGWIDMGDIGEIYRNNRVEGTRLTLPLQTSERFSKSVRLSARLGYGFGDERWKYGASAEFLLPTESNQYIALSYQDDLFQAGDNRQQNLLSGLRYSQIKSSLAGELFPIRRDFKLSRKQEFNLSYEINWDRSFATLANLRIARQYEGIFLPFGLDYFDNQRLLLDANWHFGERFFNGLNSGLWQENLYPLLHLSAELGNYIIKDKNSQYAHFRATMQQQIQSGFGKLNYRLEAGYIAGDVPFPLLQIPQGNETYHINDYSFTMMNYMEFAADTYATFYADYQFDNLLLGRVPLLRMLGMKEIISFKTMIGSLREEHNAAMALPDFTQELAQYAEASAGIAHIFGFLNLESVWRLTDRHKPDIRNWGVRLKFLKEL
jgi:hypothetical protein